MLAAYGIPVTRDVLCTSAGRGGAGPPRAVDGCPVVMKIASPDILHKSDLGLVAGGRGGGRPRSRRTYEEFMDDRGKPAKGAAIDGVLVCEMAEPGVECVVGVSPDELFGPVVMFGLGGVFVEVFDDVTFRVPPFDKAEARRMVRADRGLQAARRRPGPEAGQGVAPWST